MTTMPDSTRPQKGVIAGIDTHADVHVVAALDELGAILGNASFPTDDDGYRATYAWLCAHGTLIAAGVEGTGTYGAGIARFLVLAPDPTAIAVESGARTAVVLRSGAPPRPARVTPRRR